MREGGCCEVTAEAASLAVVEEEQLNGANRIVREEQFNSNNQKPKRK
jgi:hypothetical protein